jgi:hypothetical protein
MKCNPPRRIVTGHKSDGTAIIQADGPTERNQLIGSDDGPWFYEVWNTQESPCSIGVADSEPHEDSIVLSPPKSGTRIRVLDIPPDSPEMYNQTPEERLAHFAEIGAAEAPADGGANERHPRMHRTVTIDYGIVLEGEIVLIMDEGETVCRTGDIIIQKGTNHGWANRTDKTCRIAFILVDGEYTDELSSALNV